MTDAATSRPPLDRERLADVAPALLPGLTVEVLDTASSTNELLAARARDGAAEGLVVVAEHQTGGRGRLGRRWETPVRSSLTFSVLLRPSVPTQSWPWLPLLVGYAVHKTLLAYGFEPRLKWPNDVLVDDDEYDKKVAGILVERLETPGGPAAVVGIGLNTSQAAEELPVPTATSLAIVGDEPPDRTGLLLSMLATLQETYDLWQAGGDDAGARLRASYVAACVTIGQEVRVDLPSGEALRGRAVDVDQGGRLVVETAHGRTEVGAGDVVHVRPEPVAGRG